MAISGIARKFFEALDVSEFRIRRPESFVFLCGGPLRESATNPPSLREALLRVCISREKFSNSTNIILAETANQSFSPSRFDDLFQLEKHVASLSEVTPLILESPGSIAELGAFSQMPEISERLFIVAKNGHHPANSFISLGPLRNLEAAYRRRKIISVYDWIDASVPKAYKSDVVNDIKKDIEQIIASRKKTEKFDAKKTAHISIVILHALYFCRGANSKELKEALEILGLSIEKPLIELHLNALNIVKWIKQEQERNLKCWIPTKQFQISDIGYKSGVPNDTKRWLSDVSEAYRMNHDPRYKISQRLVAAGS